MQKGTFTHDSFVKAEPQASVTEKQERPQPVIRNPDYSTAVPERSTGLYAGLASIGNTRVLKIRVSAVRPWPAINQQVS